MYADYNLLEFHPDFKKIIFNSYIEIPPFLKTLESIEKENNLSEIEVEGITDREKKIKKIQEFKEELKIIKPISLEIEKTSSLFGLYPFFHQYQLRFKENQLNLFPPILEDGIAKDPNEISLINLKDLNQEEKIHLIKILTSLKELGDKFLKKHYFYINIQETMTVGKLDKIIAELEKSLLEGQNLSDEITLMEGEITPIKNDNNQILF